MHAKQAVLIFVEYWRGRGGETWDHDDIVVQVNTFAASKGWKPFGAKAIRDELSRIAAKDRDKKFIEKWRGRVVYDGEKATRPTYYSIFGASEKPKEFAMPTGVAEPSKRQMRIV